MTGSFKNHVTNDVNTNDGIEQPNTYNIIVVTINDTIITMIIFFVLIFDKSELVVAESLVPIGTHSPITITTNIFDDVNSNAINESKKPNKKPAIC